MGSRNNVDLIQVRLSKRHALTMDEVDQAAKDLDLSRSALCVKALKLFVDWDPNFYKAVDLWADKLQVKPSTFMENIVMDWLARLSGEMEVYGPKQQVFPEFVHYGNELLTGKDFYEKRRSDYIAHFQKELNEKDAKRANEAKKIEV